MSILENLRKGTDSPTTRLLLGAVVAVFIFWGVGSGSGDRTSILAEVNGVTITDSEYRRAYQQAARAMQRSSFTEDEQEQLRAMVLQQLIESEVMLQEAERLGIAVSDEEVARVVVKQDAFKKDGKFDERTYEKALKSMGLSRGIFEAEVRKGLTLAKIQEIAGLGVDVTDAEVVSAWKRQGTTVELQVVRLPATAFLEEIPVTDAERDAFVQQNGDKLKARYDELYDRFYNLPKRYQLRSILLRTDIAGVEKDAVRAKAEQIRAEAAGGADFGQLAMRWSEDLTASAGGALGLQAASQIDPVITAAADKAGAGKVTEVVETGRGLQVLLVEKIEEAKQTSFEEARNELAVGMIREERAPKVVQEFAAKVIEAWKATGAPPADLLASKGLTVEATPPFSLAEERIPTIGDAPPIEAVLPTAPVGQVVPTPFDVRGTTFVVAVASRDEPDMGQLELIKPLVRSRLVAERRNTVLEQWTADVKARAEIVQGTN